MAERLDDLRRTRDAGAAARALEAWPGRARPRQPHPVHPRRRARAGDARRDLRCAAERLRCPSAVGCLLESRWRFRDWPRRFPSPWRPWCWPGPPRRHRGPGRATFGLMLQDVVTASRRRGPGVQVDGENLYLTWAGRTACSSPGVHRVPQGEVFHLPGSASRSAGTKRSRLRPGAARGDQLLGGRLRSRRGRPPPRQRTAYASRAGAYASRSFRRST